MKVVSKPIKLENAFPIAKTSKSSESSKVSFSSIKSSLKITNSSKSSDIVSSGISIPKSKIFSSERLSELNCSRIFSSASRISSSTKTLENIILFWGNPFAIKCPLTFKCIPLVK